MGGGASKKYENCSCYACSKKATTKAFVKSTYVPACKDCEAQARSQSQSQAPTFYPTTFVDTVTFADPDADPASTAVKNFLDGDFIKLIGPRQKRRHPKPLPSSLPSSSPLQPTKPTPSSIPKRTRPFEAQFLVPNATPVQEEIRETSANTSQERYRPQFLVSGAEPVQEEIRVTPPTQQHNNDGYEYAEYDQYNEYNQYGEETQYGEEYEQPFVEPLSWRWTEQQQAEEEKQQEQYKKDLGSMSVGQRHCRFDRCPCVAFVNNNTVCQSCNHGEMYHRSRTEAPLVLSNVPGSGMCAHCSLPITGAGFSGWYKEDKSGSIVHDECWKLYKEKRATKCAQCRVPILKNHQGFSGRYSKVSIGNKPKVKVHKECLDVYLECRRGDET